MSTAPPSVGPAANVLAEHIDATAFPLLRAYLGGLPNGLRSYPGCQGIADYAIRLQHEFYDLWPTLDLPVSLRDALRERWHDGQYISTVLITCQSLVLRQHLGLGLEEYSAYISKRTASVLDKPMYRILLAVVSPTLLLNNLQGRWGKFVRGVALLNLGGSRGHHRLKMVSPVGLNNPLWTLFYIKTFTDLLVAARAVDVHVEAVQESATDVVFEMRWR